MDDGYASDCRSEQGAYSTPKTSGGWRWSRADMARCAQARQRRYNRQGQRTRPRPQPGPMPASCSESNREGGRPGSGGYIGDYAVSAIRGVDLRGRDDLTVLVRTSRLIHRPSSAAEVLLQRHERGVGDFWRWNSACVRPRQQQAVLTCAACRAAPARRAWPVGGYRPHGFENVGAIQGRPGSLGLRIPGRTGGCGGRRLLDGAGCTALLAWRDTHGAGRGKRVDGWDGARRTGRTAGNHHHGQTGRGSGYEPVQPHHYCDTPARRSG